MESTRTVEDANQHPALVPLRDGGKMIPPTGGMQREVDPFIPLFQRRTFRSNGAYNYEPHTKEGSFVLGRRDFLISYHAACGCRPQWRHFGTRTPLCHRCRQNRDWARKYLSRRMVRLIPAKAGILGFRIQVRGENARELVWVSGKSIESTFVSDHSEEKKTSNEEVWMGDGALPAGSVLTLRCQEDPDASLHFMLEDIGTDEALMNEKVVRASSSTDSSPKVDHNPKLISEKHLRRPDLPETSRESQAQREEKSGVVINTVLTSENEKPYPLHDKEREQSEHLFHDEKKQYQTDPPTPLSSECDSGRGVHIQSSEVVPSSVPPSSSREHVRCTVNDDPGDISVCNDDRGATIASNIPDRLAFGQDMLQSRCRQTAVYPGSDSANVNARLPTFQASRNEGISNSDVMTTSTSAQHLYRKDVSENSQRNHEKSKGTGTGVLRDTVCNVQQLPRTTTSSTSTRGKDRGMRVSHTNGKTKCNGNSLNVGAGGYGVDCIDVIEICDESGDDDGDMKSPKPTINVTTETSKSSSMTPTSVANRNVSKARQETRRSSTSFVILLLQLGRSMSQSRARILRLMLQKRDGVTVLESFRKDRKEEGSVEGCTPSHVVIDETVTVDEAAAALGLKDAKEMIDTFSNEKIKAVKPEWIVSGSLSHEPTLNQRWPGFRTSKRRVTKKTNPDKPFLKSGWIQKQRHVDEFAKIAVVKASSIKDETSFVSRMKKRRRGSADEAILNYAPKSGVVETNVSICEVRNNGIADMFDKLSKLHKICPILENDEWRTYHYAVIAGRLRSLDFDVIDRRDVLERLGKIKGFGPSAMTKVREYLKTGKCKKLTDLQKDPMRVGVSRLVRIHGAPFIATLLTTIVSVHSF